MEKNNNNVLNLRTEAAEGICSEVREIVTELEVVHFLLFVSYAHEIMHQSM